jgi:hypothetical protein
VGLQNGFSPGEMGLIGPDPGEGRRRNLLSHSISMQ